MDLKWTNIFKKKQGVVDNTAPNEEKELKMFYDIEPIDSTNAVYRMIIGQRSNGKTFSVCKHVIENYFQKGERSAYIRRYEEDITPKNISSLFDPHLSDIIALSDGQYNGVYYRAKEFHFCYYDEDGNITSKDPIAFCICRSINTAEHTKGQDAGEVHTIIFDEFATRNGYLQNEFILFCNLLSSLIRNRDNTVIYMLANTVNRYCPYFKEMGLKDVENMPQGQIFVYTYGNKDLTVAVEYCDPVKATEKVASKYFAFDNPQLEMITSGAWELQFYPHAPYRIIESWIRYEFYIEFGGQLIKGEIVANSPDLFIFFHPQTKDVKIGPKTVFYTSEFTSSRLHCRYLKDQPTDLHKLIYSLITKKAVCFSDNECGELFRNWLIETQGLKIF